MLQGLKNFSRGFALSFHGIKLFYSMPRLWKYTLLPLLMVIGTYAVLWYAGSCAVESFAGYVEEKCSALPGFLQWLATAAHSAAILLAIMLIVVIAAVSAGTLYEFFGGLFFDALIHRFAGELGMKNLPAAGWRFILRGVVDTALYSINTLLIITLFLILNIFLPIIGQLIMVLIISYRFGVVYLAMCGFHFKRSMLQTRQAAYKCRMLVLGFGGSIYLMFLFPLAVLFLLPGIILGSVLVYRELVR